MATKLGLYNGAMIAIGHRRLSDTGEAVEAGRELTAVYDQVVNECLSAGSWNFAMETIKVVSDTGVTPSFGFTEVFAKPSDWLRTMAVSEDEYFTYPLTQYYDDASFWSASTSPIYVRYVSNDTGLGFELNRWTPNFTRYVELELAARVCLKLTASASLEDQVEKKRDKARRRALNSDVMDEAQPKFAPPGSWAMSRGGRISRRERGNSGSFTG